MATGCSRTVPDPPERARPRDSQARMWECRGVQNGGDRSALDWRPRCGHGMDYVSCPQEPKGHGRPQSLECLRIRGEGMSTMPGD